MLVLAVSRGSPLSKPLTLVKKARLSVASSINAPFKFRYWELELECGHLVERRAKNKPRKGTTLRGFAAMHAGRSASEVLPAPKRVRCEMCP